MAASKMFAYNSLHLFSTFCAFQSDKDTREDIQKVFNLFDDDQTGKISLRNLKRVAKELGETMSGKHHLMDCDRVVLCGSAGDDVAITPCGFSHSCLVCRSCLLACPQTRSCWR